MVCAGEKALVICVVNPTDMEFHYGVAGSLERFQDGGWMSNGGFASSLDFWGGLGRITSPAERVFVPAIGLGALARGIGQGEYLRIEGLQAGRYRLSHRS